MNIQTKLFSLTLTLILINLTTSTLNEVSQSYQNELSSGKMTEGEMEEFMQSILSEVSSTKAHLIGNNFAEKLANFYLHDFSVYYPEQKEDSYSIQKVVKDLIDKHSDEIANENPEPFFNEVLPLLKDYYSHQILVKGEDEVYQFTLLIKIIETVITMKREKSQVYDELRKYVLAALKNFTQEAFNLFSITQASVLKDLIHESGSNLFTNLWTNADTMEESSFNDNSDKLSEIVKGFLIISIDIHKDEDSKKEEDRINLPTQHSLVYHILRVVKKSMEQKTNSARQIKLISKVVRTASEVFYSELNETQATYDTIYMINDFFTYSSNGGKEVEKFVSKFMYQKYIKDGMVPVGLNDAERRFYWIDVFNKIVQFNRHVEDKEEIVQLLENLENIFTISPVELELSTNYLDVFKTNLRGSEIEEEFFDPLNELYDFYQRFLTTQTENVDKSTLLDRFQDYILEVRNQEHPELNQESPDQIVEGTLTTETMKLGDNYLLFQLALLNENLKQDFTYRFAKHFSKAELSNVINNFKNSEWDDLRKLNYCVWKKMTNSNFSQELVNNVEKLEEVFRAFVNRSITQAAVDGSFTVSQDGAKGC